MIKRPIQEIQCFILYFYVFSREKHRYLQMWKSWMKNTLVLIYYETTHYYSTSSWKFQTARISLNISRPLNPIKLKALLVYDIFGPKGQWHQLWVSPLSAQARLNFDIYCRFLHSFERYMTWPLDRHSFEVNEGFHHIVKWWNVELVGLFSRENKKNRDEIGLNSDLRSSIGRNFSNIKI